MAKHRWTPSIASYRVGAQGTAKKGEIQWRVGDIRNPAGVTRWGQGAVHHGHGEGEIRVCLLGCGRDPRLPARAWACSVSRARRGAGAGSQGHG
jgi:hypothetical protein